MPERGNRFDQFAVLEREQLNLFTQETMRAKPFMRFDTRLLRERLGNGSHRVIAIDIGGSKITSATFAINQNSSTYSDEVTRQSRNGEGYLNFLQEVGQKSDKQSMPVGISIGAVIEGTRLIHTSHMPNLFRDLAQFDGDFSRVIPRLKKVVNDSVAGTIGSLMEAQRRYPDTKQIIYLTNGSGLGAAVLTEDMIWSMEPGHIETLPELNPYGAKTTCVFTNTETSCLHAVTSGIGIENIYLQQTQEKVDGEELARRLSSGDKLVEKLYENSAMLTAITIKGIASAFDMFANPSETTIVCHGGTFNVDKFRDLVVQFLKAGLRFEPRVHFTKDFKNPCLEGAALAAIIS